MSHINITVCVSTLTYMCLFVNCESIKNKVQNKNVYTAFQEQTKSGWEVFVNEHSSWNEKHMRPEQVFQVMDVIVLCLHWTISKRD